MKAQLVACALLLAACGETADCTAPPVLIPTTTANPNAAWIARVRGFANVAKYDDEQLVRMGIEECRGGGSDPSLGTYHTLNPGDCPIPPA